MKADDKRLDHLEHISLTNSRVDLTTPIIFLCGGVVDLREASATSVRSALMGYLHKVRCKYVDNLVLAEHFKDWINDSVYDDLVLFEDDIASVASLIIIILESPGALTELGLFVRRERLKRKILVLVKDSHYNEDSFIKLGPLRYLERVREASVCAFPWSEDSLDSSLKAVLKEMHGEILSCIETFDKSELFDVKSRGHVSFVLYEIIKTYRALKLTELELYLDALGLKFGREELKRILFLLDKFDLVKVHKRGRTNYYYAHVDISKITFGGRFDQNQAKISAMQFYAFNEAESQRFEVIKMVYPSPDKAKDLAREAV